MPDTKIMSKVHRYRGLQVPEVDDDIAPLGIASGSSGDMEQATRFGDVSLYEFSPGPQTDSGFGRLERRERPIRP